MSFDPEYERGRREALAAALAAETKREFDNIRTALAENSQAIVTLATEVRSLRNEQETRDKINVALIDAGASSGAKRLTRFQLGSMGLAGIVSLGSLTVAVIQAIHG